MGSINLYLNAKGPKKKNIQKLETAPCKINIICFVKQLFLSHKL